VFAEEGPGRLWEAFRVMATESKMEISFWEKFTDSLGALSEGIVGFLGRLFGSSNERQITTIGYVRPRSGQDEHSVIPGSLLDQVNSLEEIMVAMTNESLKDLTRQFRACLAGTFAPTSYHKKPRPEGAEVYPVPPACDIPAYILEVIPPGQEPATAAGDGQEILSDPLGLANLPVPAILEDLLPVAFAANREAARRAKNMRHFDVQIVGGVVLHRGNIAEMVTGEGKTLVATLPAYLNALEKKGVHIVTVNDYLARRDCEWMLPIYQALDINAGYIQSDQDPVERRRAYDCEITYGTNSEFGFDYLRDNMKPARWADNNYPPEYQQVQKSLNYAIIDEVDNILIDEARTPLIISGPAFGDPRRYSRANDIAVQLSDLQKQSPGTYFEVKEKERTCHLTDDGVRKAEELAGVESFYTAGNMEWPHLIDNALKAHHLYHKDKQYVVMRHPETGEQSIIIVDEFTGRLMIGRQWSDGLHQAVEAKHAREGVKIKEETQTLATITLQNFFKLYQKLAGMTGTAMTEANEFWKIYKLDVIAIPTNRPLIRDDYPDQIYLSEKEKWDAVVTEIERLNKWDAVLLKDGTMLTGTIKKETDEALDFEVRETRERRTIAMTDIDEYEYRGRPMLIGTTDVAKSEKLSAMLKRRGVKHELLNAKPEFAARESEIVAQAGRIGAVTIATNMAGRGTDIILGGNPETLAWARLRDQYPTRLDVPDDVWKKTVKDIEEKEKMKEEGRRVAKMGGLHILGTERHEARRIDNQLRGRSGRQGDPGSSRFYLCLEDDLMRIFAGDWVKSVLTRLGMEEGQAIESRMVSRRIAAAQKKVEEHNFDIRKNLLEYDEVMDHQRKRVYGYRQEILEGANCRSRILQMIEEQIDLALGRFFDDDYGPATFAEFASKRLSVELDAADFSRCDFETAERTAREKASRSIPTQIHEAMEENLNTDEDPKEWKWQAMAHTVNTRWGLKATERQLKQIGRDNLAENLIAEAEKALAAVDLTGGRPFLEPDWGRRSLCDWVRLKFQIKVDPAQLADKEPAQIKQAFMDNVKQLYHRKEVEFPVKLAMTRFMSDRPQPGAAGHRYDREGLYRWSMMRFPELKESLSEEDFRTQSRARLQELLLKASEQSFPKAGPDQIDAVLEDAFSGAAVAEDEDAREVCAWFKAEVGLDVPPQDLKDLTLEQARQKLADAYDARYRPEMKRMERSLVLNQLDTAWKNHLYTMDHLRQGIGLVGYAQIDPKTEYKRQGMKEFEGMWEGLQDRVTDSVFRMEEEEGFQEGLWAIGAAVHEQAKPTLTAMEQEQAKAIAGSKEGKKVEPIRNRQDRVGRNDPCPCGSGKKYKNCHMRLNVGG
jgi:preprotein translocase subunit SecA